MHIGIEFSTLEAGSVLDLGLAWEENGHHTKRISLEI